ncbi:MAG: hypothetical protein AB7H81_21310 [Vicinamibacterales bacterium]
MNVEHHASNCRWAVPTLFLPAPYCWEAEDRPWACIRTGSPRVLETTEVCRSCPHWKLGRGRAYADAATIDSVSEALEDAYRARASCRKVIEAFGRVSPFISLLAAEERHVRALGALLDQLGAEVPPDTWPARVSAPDTLVEACAAASRAGLQQDALYQRLIPLVRHPASRRTLRRVARASYTRYLPAFRRCFARELKPTGRPRGIRLGRALP